MMPSSARVSGWTPIVDQDEEFSSHLSDSRSSTSSDQLPDLSDENIPTGKVKRPRNAFIIFRCEYLAERRSNESPTQMSSISKDAGIAWREASEDVKFHYKRLADEEKVEHAKAHPGYRYQPTRSTRKLKRKSESKPYKGRGRKSKKGTGNASDVAPVYEPAGQSTSFPHVTPDEFSHHTYPVEHSIPPEQNAASSWEHNLPVDQPFGSNQAYWPNPELFQGAFESQSLRDQAPQNYTVGPETQNVNQFSLFGLTTEEQKMFDAFFHA